MFGFKVKLETMVCSNETRHYVRVYHPDFPTDKPFNTEAVMDVFSHTNLEYAEIEKERWENFFNYDGLEYRTYKFWNNSGYRLKKGVKSHRRDPYGMTPLFSEDQVYKVREKIELTKGLDIDEQYERELDEFYEQGGW